MARLPKPKERWFPVPDDPDDARVLIRHLNKVEVADIDSDSMEAVADDDGKVSLGYNLRRQAELTICRAIVDWERFFDADGSPMKCTEGNKLLARKKFPWLEEFVHSCLKSLAEEVNAETEAAEGNS